MAASIRLEGLPPHADVGPGTQQRLTLSIANASAIVDQFALTVTGLDENWYSLTPPTVSLFPGATATAELTLHPPSGVEAAAGTYPFTVRAMSNSDPSSHSGAESELRIARIGIPTMEVRPRRAAGRQAAFTVKWKNPTNGPVSIELAVRDTEDGVRTFLDPEGPVPVPPGQERSVQVTVRPRNRETIGPPHPYELEFRGLRPGTEDLQEPGLKRFGQFTYTPPLRTLALPPWLRRLPFWALLALLLLLLALLFLAGKGVGHVVAGGQRPISVPTVTTIPSPTRQAATAIPTVAPTTVAPPTIQAFGLQVGPKGETTIAWQILGAKQITLDGRPVGSSGQMAIKVAEARTLELTASDDGGSIVRILRVVPPPVKRLALPLPALRIGFPEIRRFSLRLDPRTGAPTLTWEVRGADVRLLNNKPVTSAGSESLSTSAAPRYVLQAMNAAGETTSVVSLPSLPSPRSQRAILHLPSIPLFTLRHLHDGQPYSLVWKTTNATAATLNGAAVPLSGSQILHPPLSSKTYILAARNPNGQVNGYVKITVK